ncbi:putative sulfate exporter family transporter, partial [Streptococcus suis]
MIQSAIRLLPGVILCVAVTVVAKLLEHMEVGFTGQPYIEALVLAIVLGVIIRTAWTPGPTWDAGLRFSAKNLLEVAVVLL